jgi:uncharacterized damage-inducible protein DinB
VDGVIPELQPVAHALIQVRDELGRLGPGVTREALHARPGGVASLAFQLRHLAGSTDRLFTYARGEPLSPAQRADLALEKSPPADDTLDALLERVRAVLDAALKELQTLAPGDLERPREVGGDRLPSNVRGLLFHAAEHAARHAGQVATTVKVIRGGNAHE